MDLRRYLLSQVARDLERQRQRDVAVGLVVGVPMEPQTFAPLGHVSVFVDVDGVAHYKQDGNHVR